MKVIKTEAELHSWLEQKGRKDKTLGLVPTMGYLHEGHQSLIKRAREQNDLVVVSVFVNPIQFGAGEDFEKYPRDIERDVLKAEEAGADVIFNPEADEIYLKDFSSAVEVRCDMTKKLCGASRPGHFNGVTTIVNILFNIIRPDKAYFGQKDAQQAIIIKKLVRDLHIPVKIVVCPIVREADGLAMSSRNIYLSETERKQALSLSRGLSKARDFIRSYTNGCSTDKIISVITDEISSQPLAAIDYVKILDADNLEDLENLAPGKSALAAVAVRFGKTRLIDNSLFNIPTKETANASDNV